MEYIRRIVDDELDIRSEAFNAINIIGPKGCGKTRTAKERCSTVIEFQDEEKRDGYLAVAETSPKLFLSNVKPILFDEWQDAPKIWGAIRKDSMIIRIRSAHMFDRFLEQEGGYSAYRNRKNI